MRKLPRTALSAGFAAVICFTSASAATIIPSDQLLGTIRPGTPASEAAELEMVRFLVDALNDGNSPITYAGGGLASGVNLGDNPNDDGSPEEYRLWAPSGLTVPAALPTSADQTETSSVFVSLGGVQYQYILAKFGPNSAAFWIGNMSGDIEIPNLFEGSSGQFNGLSHYTLMNPGTRTTVPDGGVTLGLLGLAMAALLPLHKRLTKSTGES